MKKILVRGCLYYLMVMVGAALYAEGANLEYSWKCMKDKGDPITALAPFDSGRAVYAGDSSGKLFMINREGSINLEEVASSAIDSIALIAPNSEGYGTFAYLSGGEVYIYDIVSKKSENTDIPEKANSIVYVPSDALYAFSDSNHSGKLYRYDNSKWQEAGESQIGEEVRKIKYSASKGLNAITSSGVLKHDESGWISIGESEINNITDFISSDKVFVVKENNSIHQYANNKWQELLTGTNVSCLAYDEITGKLFYGSDNDVGIIDNSEAAGAFNFNAPVSCMTAVNNGVYVGTSEGTIYSNLSSTPSPLSVNVSFTANAPGDKHTNDSIYRITISGQGLDQDQLFSKGYNGFKYTLIPDGDTSRAENAYPIAGVVYSGDCGAHAALNPRPITFLWMGPKCDNDGEHNLTVVQTVHDMNNDVDVVIASVTVSLIAGVMPDPSSCSSISVNAAPGVGIQNGVSAIPVLITLLDNNSQVIPPTNELYDHLIFADSINSTLNYDQIIGCNPTDANKNMLAVLPYSSVETDDMGYIKYGLLHPASWNNGRVFYLFQGASGSSRPPYVFLMKDGSDNPFRKQSLTITNVVPSSIIFSQNLSNNLNQGEKATVTLNDGQSLLNVANTQGDSKGNYCGYLDFILANGKNFNTTNGIYAVFPEGLGVRKIDDRFNFSKMSAGYYFTPVSSQGPLLGLWGSGYDVAPMPKFCKTTSGNNIYSYLFDQHGRYTADHFKDDGGAHWGGDYLVVYLTNNSKVPLKFVQDGDCNTQFAVDGLLVPPGAIELEVTTNGYDAHYYHGSNKTYLMGAYDITGSNKGKEIFTASFYEHNSYPHNGNLYNSFYSDFNKTLPTDNPLYLSAQKSNVYLGNGGNFIKGWHVFYDNAEQVKQKDGTVSTIGAGENYSNGWIYCIRREGYWWISSSDGTLYWQPR